MLEEALVPLAHFVEVVHVELSGKGCEVVCFEVFRQYPDEFIDIKDKEFSSTFRPSYNRISFFILVSLQRLAYRFGIGTW